MAGTEDGFMRANDRFRQRAYQRWHRRQLKRQILRSQIGFADFFTARPAVCAGCANYHGQAYGFQREQRTVLICAMHPHGWQGTSPCPDWHRQEDTMSYPLGPLQAMATSPIS